jgi:hypothetical protein
MYIFRTVLKLIMENHRNRRTTQPSNATVTVNDIVVTLPESVPYGEYNLSKYYNVLMIL